MQLLVPREEEWAGPRHMQQVERLRRTDDMRISTYYAICDYTNIAITVLVLPNHLATSRVRLSPNSPS